MAHNKKVLLLALTVLILASLACATLSGGDSKSSPTRTPKPVEPSATPTILEEIPVEPSATPQPKEPEATATFTPTATEAPKEVFLSLTGFLQDGTSLVVGYILENPNPNLAVENLEVLITAYGPDGAVLDESSNDIALLPPGSQLGLAYEGWLDDGDIVDRVDLEIVPGTFFDGLFGQPIFEVTQTDFYPDDWYSVVTGQVLSLIEQNVDELRVSALLFDADGMIVGGGYTYLGFLPALNQSALEIPVTIAEGAVVDHWMIYPITSYFSEFTDPGDATLTLQSVEFAQKDTTVSYIFKLLNPGTGSITDAEFQANIYDESGKVLGEESGYLPVIGPGEFAFVNDTWLTDEGIAAEVVIHINPADVDKDFLYPSNPIFLQEPSVFGDGYSTYITMDAMNNSDYWYEGGRVGCAVYSPDDGPFIGGGYSYLQFIAPQDTTGFTTSVVVPDDAEIGEVKCYATNSSFNFEWAERDREQLDLILIGAVQDDNDVVATFSIFNANEFPIQDTDYMVTYYDETGQVLSSDYGWIPVIFPAEGVQMVVESWLVADDILASDYVVQLNAGERMDDPPMMNNPFTGVSLGYIDDYFPKVNVEVTNPLDYPVNDLRVYVQLFDAEDNFLGGGSGYTDEIPAGGSVEVEIWVTSLGEPARIDVYPMLSSMSNLDQ